MNREVIREKIGSDIYFTCVRDDKFRSSRISVNFVVPLREDSASVNAIVPYILRRGSADYPDFQRLNEKLAELYGASLYADVRKIGDAQILNLSVESLNNRYALDCEDIAAQSAQLILSLLLNPKAKDGGFPDDDLRIEKKALIEQIESEMNDKRTYAVSRMESIMFEGEPYGLSRNGTVDQVKEISEEGAFSAYRELTEKGLIEVVYIGDTDGAAIRDSFKKSFANVSRKPASKIISNVKKAAEKVKEVTENMDVKQAKLVMGFRTGGGPEMNTDAMRVACALYGSTPFSKLFLNVREKLSLCYYCSSRYDRVKGYMLVNSGVELQNKEKAVKEILRQLELVQKGDFTADELSDTKLSLKNNFLTIYDSLSAMEAWYLSRIFSGDLISPMSAAADIQGVSAEDVVKVMKKVTLDTIYLLCAGEVEQ